MQYGGYKLPFLIVGGLILMFVLPYTFFVRKMREYSIFGIMCTLASYLGSLNEWGKRGDLVTANYACPEFFTKS